jgi:hypothetical protein
LLLHRPLLPPLLLAILDGRGLVGDSWRMRAEGAVGAVYIGHDSDARRMAAWLRAAELELLGVPCVAADQHVCVDAPAHARSPAW